MQLTKLLSEVVAAGAQTITGKSIPSLYIDCDFTGIADVKKFPNIQSSIKYFKEVVLPTAFQTSLVSIFGDPKSLYSCELIVLHPGTGSIVITGPNLDLEVLKTLLRDYKEGTFKTMSLSTLDHILLSSEPELAPSYNTTLDKLFPNEIN